MTTAATPTGPDEPFPLPSPAPAAPRGGLRAVLPLPLALAVLCLTYWCVDIVTPGVPVLQRDLALSGAGAGLVVSIFFFGRLLSNIPSAFLIERIGPRGCAMLGGGLLAAGSVLVATAAGEPSLLAGRAIQGAGVAFLASSGLLSLVRTWTGGGTPMTAFNVSAGIGGSIGLFLGGVITAAYGWREVFWLSAVIGLALAVATIAVHTVQGRRARRGGTRSEPAQRSSGETRRGSLIAGLLANLLTSGNYSIWVVSLGLLAADRFRTGPEALGTLLLIVSAIHLLAAIPAGTAIRRHGIGSALAFGFATGAAGIAVVAVAPSYLWLYPGMTLFAIGQIAANTAAGDLLLQAGGGGGRAVGLIRLTADIGLVAGPVMVGWLSDQAGTTAPFAVLGGLTAVAAVIAGGHQARRRDPAVTV